MQELAVLASSALAVQRQFTMVADNIANANTDGFKKMELEFKENVSRPKGYNTASYVEDRGLTVSQAIGDMRRTGNSLDMASTQPNTFFAVQGLNGEVQYTKRGSMVVDATGTLMLPTGEIVLDNANAPIQIPTDAKNVGIGRDGTVSTELGQVGTIGVYTFAPEDMKMLQRAGNGAFVPTQGGAQVVETPNILQGYVESSNVNAVEEMTNMQMVSAAYQRSLNTMRGIEELEQRAIRTLGQVQ